MKGGEEVRTAVWKGRAYECMCQYLITDIINSGCGHEEVFFTALGHPESFNRVSLEGLCCFLRQWYKGFLF